MSFSWCRKLKDLQRCLGEIVDESKDGSFVRIR